jgi:hypothetical protein
MKLLTNEIGGYFALDLENYNNFPHADGLMFQSLRNSLVYFLKSVNCSKIYIPYYCCPTIASELKHADISFSFYHINSRFEPEIDTGNIMSDEYFFYVNYFGQCDDVVTSLSKKILNLIIDNSHSLFGSLPSAACHLFSPRKFAGLPDGGVMLCPSYKIIEPDCKDKTSIMRMNHLLLRASGSTISGYTEFKKNRITLQHQPSKSMSSLTRRLIKHIDWEQCKKVRTQNFLHLHQALRKYNHNNISQNIVGAFCYPLFIPENDIGFFRSCLIEEKIYVPYLWPEIDKDMLNAAEKDIKDSTLLLPVDQRYNFKNMEFIIKKVKDIIKLDK